MNFNSVMLSIALISSLFNYQAAKAKIDLSEFLESDKLAVQKIEKTYISRIRRVKIWLDRDPLAYIIRNRANNRVGLPGDVLVSLDSASSSMIIGHAAIVSHSSDTTIESFKENYSPIGVDGVQYYTNVWHNKKGAFWLRAKKASAALNTAAVNYASNQVGKPYNINFLDKERTDCFYCSQLVWQSWFTVGIDIDSNGGSIVSPVDIVNSENLYMVARVGD